MHELLMLKALRGIGMCMETETSKLTRASRIHDLCHITVRVCVGWLVSVIVRRLQKTEDPLFLNVSH